MRLDYHVLDVFTDKRFGGNPLAVVLDADALDGERMQVIAREFNLSETVFVLHATEQGAHRPRAHLHADRRAALRRPSHRRHGGAAGADQVLAAGPGDALVVLEEGIGTVRVGVRLRAGAAPFAEFDAPKLPESVGVVPPADRLAAALGLIPAEIGFENHKPTRYSAGNAFIFVPIASLEAIGKAGVASAHWNAATQGNVGMFLYCRQTVHTTSSFHARMFAPHNGIAEDPATGSAAAAFAGVVHRFDALPDGSHKRIIEQGFEMGRQSLISLSLQVERGHLDAVRIGGHAVHVAEGKIEV